MSGVRIPISFSFDSFSGFCLHSFPHTSDSCLPPLRIETFLGLPPHSSSHLCSWVKSEVIFVPMTEVWMAASTQIRWDHACECSLYVMKSWLDKGKRWLFYNSEAQWLICRAGMPISREIHFLLGLTTFPIPRSISTAVNWVQELRIQRQIRLLTTPVAKCCHRGIKCH